MHDREKRESRIFISCELCNEMLVSTVYITHCRKITSQNLVSPKEGLQRGMRLLKRCLQ